VYWISTAIDVVFEFKIIHEVFLDAFRPYFALQDLGTALFKWAALIMVLVAAVLISISPSWNDPLVKTIIVAHRCVRVVQCGIVLFLLAFSKHVGFSWKRQGFGIALGFGLYAGVELVTNALISGEHISQDMVNVANLGVFNVCVALWLAYVVLNRRETRVPILVPQRWDEALMDVQPHGQTESLIPMFEHMVDRAFSKTQGA
jgi:energy-converting hydrogenase Eha subunit E